MSQKKRVEAHLRESGTISRNWCLNLRITRLAAIMRTLKLEGWQFMTYKADGDYIYRLINTPPYEKEEDKEETNRWTIKKETGQISLDLRP